MASCRDKKSANEWKRDTYCTSDKTASLSIRSGVLFQAIKSMLSAPSARGLYVRASVAQQIIASKAAALRRGQQTQPPENGLAAAVDTRSQRHPKLLTQYKARCTRCCQGAPQTESQHRGKPNSRGAALDRRRLQ